MSRSHWIVAAFGSLFALGVLPSAPCSAGEREFKNEITALLDQGWRPTPSETTHAELADHFAAAQSALPGDPRAAYAYALVQFRQRKYDEAIKLLDQVIAADKANLPARRARIWLLILTKKHSLALVEMDSLTKQMPKDEKQGEAEEEFTKSAAFLGRMFAYLEGPGAGLVNDTIFIDQKQKQWERLTPGRREAYEKGYRKVSGRFAELTQGKQQTQADAKADEEKQKEKSKQDLAVEKAQVDADLAGLDAKADKIRADASKELSELDAQIRPLTAQLAQLNANASAIQGDLLILQSNVATLVNQANSTKDQIEAAALLLEAQTENILASRSAANLRAVQLQGADVAGRRAGLLGRRQNTENRAQAGLDALDRQAAQLRATQKRIGFDEQKANKPATGFTAKVTALSSSMTALTTYDELPLEEEKQRILDTLK